MRWIAYGLIMLMPLNAVANTGFDKQQADALHLDWRDTSISSADNFYAWANGRWQQQNPIPPEYSSWGTFYRLQKQNLDRIHKLLIEAAANNKAKPNSIEQKIGDFYFSGMDIKAINRLGIEPLNAQFKAINAIKTQADLQRTIAKWHAMGVDVFFNIGNMQDFKDSKVMIGVVTQGGLGLPDRDYYVKNSEKFKHIRKEYVNYIAKLLELAGDSPHQAKIAAHKIMSIETTFAKASMTQVAQRDPHAIYHMKTMKQLQKMTPNFSWEAYFSALGLHNIAQVNVAMPEFLTVFNQQLVVISLDDWKQYLRWHLLDEFVSYLSNPFVEEEFKMASVLSGTKKLLPRWQRVVNVENSVLGFAIGRLYVERYFSEQDKQQVLAILANIRKVLRHDLNTLAWMTPATRQAALKKLALMEERVGYPDKWRDYKGLTIDRGPYVLNMMRANRFLVKRALDKIGKPVDRSEWAMTPQTINAYYDPSMNNINMPAGILQPPFFDSSAPLAVNYGAIGFVMGHEITHGFDDQGAQFDGYGNLKNWWTPSDLAKFKQATNCIRDQFSQYKVNGNLPVQGNLVVGEATADLGGLTLAWRAFEISSAFKDAKTIHGLSPQQQFFLAAAHVWAANVRPEQARHLIMTDPHPPMIYRVNGTLANMPEFQKAFGITRPSPMVNASPCIIW